MLLLRLSRFEDNFFDILSLGLTSHCPRLIFQAHLFSSSQNGRSFKYWLTHTCVQPCSCSCFCFCLVRARRRGRRGERMKEPPHLVLMFLSLELDEDEDDRPPLLLLLLSFELLEEEDDDRPPLLPLSLELELEERHHLCCCSYSYHESYHARVATRRVTQSKHMRCKL